MLADVSRSLARRTLKPETIEGVSHIYQPLRYAREPHEAYLGRYGAGSKRVLLLGMNPGPFGMAQTGVPFGEIAAVRDWMGIEGRVGRPRSEHPKRPIEGFGCQRSEVSGRRLWGWAQERFGSADAFFAQHFVTNYCPWVFMEESGKNRTPDKLDAETRDRIYGWCDRALREVVGIVEPEWLIGVGKFAEDRAKVALAEEMYAGLKIGRILHPSPASPAANRGWAPQAEKQLEALGLL